jgi:hypothetical protein
MLQGNVGIGTSSPANFGGTTLQVNHASSYSSVLASSGAYTMQFMTSQTNGVMNMGARSNHHVSITTNDLPRLTADTSGHITQPYQPICTLQPDTSGNVTTANSTDHIVGWKTVSGRQTLLRSGLTLGASSGTTIANGGSTGRITFSTGGVYYFDCTIRMENTPGTGNLKLRHNGNTIHRMHVETWARYNYAHAWISRCVTASANDYVEFVVACPSGTFSGSNDTVNWLTIIKVA